MDCETDECRPSQNQRKIYKVVLTGGPCGGKTTGQSRLCTFFENIGWKVYRVPETASLLLSSFSQAMMDTFFGESANRFHGSGGIKFAELNEEETETSFKNCLVICDRGTMDASAFISPLHWEAILHNNNFNPVELRDNRYNQIIHMVSAANGAEDFYSVEDHSCRSEGIDLARNLDACAARAWIGHPYFDVIDNSTDFDAKIRKMINSVCQKICIDTGDRLKRNARKVKFLVNGPLSSDSLFPSFEDFYVEHVYLRTNSRKMQARLRKRGKNNCHSYTHTIRKPEKLGQIVEVKTAISQRDWINMIAQADEDHFPVYKTRRCFLYDNQYFQLDIYKEPCHKRCEGLMLLETYTTLDSEELQRRLPPFLNIEKEVTGLPAFSMFNLSLRDEWDQTKKFCINIAEEDDDSGIN